MATPYQIKKIHSLIYYSGLKDYEYRAMLEGYGVESSKELSDRQAEDFIKKLCDKPFVVPQNGKRWSNLDGRKGMADGKSMRMMEWLFVDMSAQDTLIGKQKAFLTWLKNYRHKTPEQITASETPKIVGALLKFRKNEVKKAVDAHFIKEEKDENTGWTLIRNTKFVQPQFSQMSQKEQISEIKAKNNRKKMRVI